VADARQLVAGLRDSCAEVREIADRVVSLLDWLLPQQGGAPVGGL
jgi:hypothetical protein